MLSKKSLFESVLFVPALQNQHSSISGLSLTCCFVKVKNLTVMRTKLQYKKSKGHLGTQRVLVSFVKGVRFVSEISASNPTQ